MRKKRFFLIIFLLCGFALVSAIYWLIETPTVSCDQKIMREFLSPSKERKAVIIRVGCGATTRFRYSAAVIDPKIDTDLSKEYFFSMEGSDEIKVIWDNEYSIVVEHGRPSKIFRKAIVWRGDPIIYHER